MYIVFVFISGFCVFSCEVRMIIIVLVFSCNIVHASDQDEMMKREDTGCSLPKQSATPDIYVGVFLL